MKNFAINILEKAGYTWDHGKGKLSDGWPYLLVRKNLKSLELDSAHMGFEQLILPRDWDKFKSYLGVGGFERGKVYKANDRLVRFKNKTNGNVKDQDIDCFSQLTNAPFFYTQSDGVWCYNELLDPTKEEAAKLEEAERDNGYFWDGEELIKVPEYVKVFHDNKIYPVMSKDTHGYNIDHDHMQFVGDDVCSPATKEEHEAQESERARYEYKSPAEVLGDKRHKLITDKCEDLKNECELLKSKNEEVIREYNKLTKEREAYLTTGESSRIKELESNLETMFKIFDAMATTTAFNQEIISKIRRDFKNI